MSRIQKLTEKIFKDAVLMYVSVGFWEGKIQQDEEDIKALGITLDEEKQQIYSPGHKILIPLEHLKPFKRFRSMVMNGLAKWSYTFPVRGVRYIPKAKQEVVEIYLKRMFDKPKNQEEKDSNEKDGIVSWQEMVDEFIEKYPAIMEEVKQKHPDDWPRLEKHYPSVENLRLKFKFIWTRFTWDVARIDGITKEIEGEHRQRMTEMYSDFVRDSIFAFRATVKDAAANFRAILERDDKINARSINAFNRMLDRFSDPSMNLFRDTELIDMVNKIKVNIGSQAGWIENVSARTLLKNELDSLISFSSDEASIAMTHAAYFEDDLMPSEPVLDQKKEGSGILEEELVET